MKEDKKMFPFGCMPVATVDGCRMGQTRSQMRYLATRAGLYNPKDAKCAYLNDNIMDQWDGVCAASQKGPEAMGPALAGLLACVNKQMCDNNSTYVAGNTVGPADFCVAGIYANMVDPKTSGTAIPAEAKAAMQKCYDMYPKICESVKKVLENPKLAAYISKRPAKAQ